MKVIDDIKPRRWQSIALRRWQRDQRGVVKVVTGGGKTVFAYLCIQAFAEATREPSVVILVPSIALMDQWYVDLLQNMTVPEEDVVCFSGNSRNLEPGAINIIVLNTARRLAPCLADVLPEGRLLVVDECHRAGSSQNSLALRGEWDATLGLSATPERGSDSGFEELVEPSLAACGESRIRARACPGR